MRKVFILLVSLLSFVTSFSQVNDASLHSEIDTNVRKKNADQTVLAGVLDDIVSNKINRISGVVASGTNAYSAAIPGVTSLTTDLEFQIRFTNANTGAATLNITTTGAGAIPIKKTQSGNVATALSGGEISNGQILILSYDGTNFQIIGSSSGGSYAGSSPTTTAVGGLPAGSSIFGLSYDAIIQSTFCPYINPFFTLFNNDILNTVETGSTLTGAHPFAWTMNLGSGVVPTIDIVDNTASSTLLAGTSNDGSQSVTITTIQLNSDGATQSWKGVGNNTSPTGTFNSSNWVVTAHFKYFAGSSSASVTNSATVRALTTSNFATSGSFTFGTGTANRFFTIALPPGKTLDTVIDNTIGNVDITNTFTSPSNINVLDAGSTNRSYSIKELALASPYGSSHTFTVTYH